MLISVIISTYNSPLWLEKVLWGYCAQEDQGFEIVVADDGSGPDTRALVQKYARVLGEDRIRHVWHEDRGFRKSMILNKAVVASAGDYLIFTDGDCIPRRDFIGIHRRLAKRGRYLSGGYYKLPMRTSALIDEYAVSSGMVFEHSWLYRNGMRPSFKSLRLTLGNRLRLFLDAVIPTKSTWNGNNSSAFREDILRVNGHDERMAYGGQDVEMGYRMVHAGIAPLRIRYRALVLHLDHSRGYANEESIAKNQRIRQQTLAEKLSWTDYGIEQQ